MCNLMSVVYVLPMLPVPVSDAGDVSVVGEVVRGWSAGGLPISWMEGI